MMKTSDLIWQDAQHQELLAIIEELKTRDAPDPLLIDKLSDYVTYHFALEEKYMKITAYPNAKVHSRAHRFFAEKIQSMRQSKLIMTQGLKNPAFKNEVTDFLSDWLITHIMGIDKELEDHIMKSRFK